MQLKHGLVGAGIMVLGVSLAVPAFGYGVASAQQVRALGSGAAVRLDPSDSSPVIANLAAGATLDWIGESGPYHIVSIPGQPGEDDLIGYVLAAEVEIVGGVSAGVPGVPGGVPPPGVPPPTTGSLIPDIHAQYERSKARRSSGLERSLRGGTLAIVAIATTQIVFAVADEDAYADSASHRAAVDIHSGAATVRNAFILSGVGLLAWGAADYVLGRRDIEAMEAELPTLADPGLEVQYADASARRGSGKRRFTWGAIMAGGSYATVRWLPWLGVPDRADYDTEWQYLSAVHRRDRTETANRWFIGVGGVLGIWGALDWVLGSREMSEIEAISRLTAAPGLRRIPVDAAGPDLFVRRALGRTEIGLAWSR